MNIYGDMRICIKCKKRADIVEKGEDYCADCWFEKFSGMTFNKYDKLIKEAEQNEKVRINQKKI